jgi:DNA-binding protein HU-beta
MTKQSLIDQVETKLRAKQRQLTKRDIVAVMDETFTCIKAGLRAGETFRYPGFGSWRTQQVAARTGRHPQTGRPLAIAAKTRTRWREAKGFLTDNGQSTAPRRTARTPTATRGTSRSARRRTARA